MQLSHQLLNQLRGLLDKPVSKPSLKQIHVLLNHPTIPICKALLCCLEKYRGDLIIYILAQDLLIKNSQGKDSSKMILESILKHIMKFTKFEEVLQIWRIILLKVGNQERGIEFKLKYGYQYVVKQAVKVTDLERKDKLFWLVSQNMKLLWGEGCKKLIIEISQSYFKIFERMLIYQKHYVSVIRTLLEIFSKNTDTLPQLTEQCVYSLSEQLQLILTNTIAKAFHGLHNQSLETLSIIAEQYSQFKHHNTVKILRCIDAYLFRKPTRDQARKAFQNWSKISQNMDQIAKEKMEKVRQSYFHKKERKNESEVRFENQNNKVLIENVLSRANEYRTKFNVPFVVHDQKYMGESGRFLKKGDGVGGGKAHLQPDGHKKGHRQHRRYEQIVQNCLSGNQYFLSQLPKKKQLISKNQSELPMSQILQKKKRKVQEPKINMIDSQIQTQILEFENETEHKSEYNESTIVEDQEVEEISNLIDLAYSYKFTLSDK